MRTEQEKIDDHNLYASNMKELGETQDETERKRLEQSQLDIQSRWANDRKEQQEINRRVHGNED